MNEKKRASVSVIIPFYSRVDWLEEAIESVLNQILPADEIIVVNDGSEEDIEFLEKKYVGKVIFFKQKNQGSAVARNLGIEKSKGDIIAFLDSDDLWEEDKLEVQIHEMESHDYKWSATGYNTFGWGEAQYIVPYMSDKLCWEHLYNTTKIATPTVAVYRCALVGNRFAVDMKNGQDTFLWYKLANEFVLGVIDKPLVKVRKRENSTCRNSDAWIKTRAILWDKMCNKNELLLPKRRFTRMGYEIASYLYGLMNQEKAGWSYKILLAMSWGAFRIDEFILRMKEPDMAKFRKIGK